LGIISALGKRFLIVSQHNFCIQGISMRFQLDEMILELQSRLKESKGIRNKILLEQALEALQELKKASERMV